MQTQVEVTQLLNAWSQGSNTAFETLWPLVYDELHRLAAGLLKREGPGHTLQPTALVNEAYLRLCQAEDASWESRRHFYGFAAQVMRHILVDYVRRRQRQKRGGAAARVTLSQLLAQPAPDAFDPEVLALHEALERFARLDARQARLLECHYFIGLTVEELAELFDCSASTIKRELRSARAWLQRELSGGRKAEKH